MSVHGSEELVKRYKLNVILENQLTTSFIKKVAIYLKRFRPRESNKEMKGSYVMVDPLGRFFKNINGYHIYSEPVIDIKPMKALRSVGWHWKKFSVRGGVYNW